MKPSEQMKPSQKRAISAVMKKLAKATACSQEPQAQMSPSRRLHLGRSLLKASVVFVDR
jgi:hypothetical protein